MATVVYCFIPCLRKQDSEERPDIVAASYARWISNAAFSPSTCNNNPVVKKWSDLLNEKTELAKIANMDKKWIYFTILVNALLLSLVIFTFLFKMAFRCFSCGRKNTNPGYTNKEMEDSIFEINGI